MYIRNIDDSLSVFCNYLKSLYSWRKSYIGRKFIFSGKSWRMQGEKYLKLKKSVNANTKLKQKIRNKSSHLMLNVGSA